MNILIALILCARFLCHTEDQYSVLNKLHNMILHQRQECVPHYLSKSNKTDPALVNHPRKLHRQSDSDNTEKCMADIFKRNAGFLEKSPKHSPHNEEESPFSASFEAEKARLYKELSILHHACQGERNQVTFICNHKGNLTISVSGYDKTNHSTKFSAISPPRIIPVTQLASFRQENIIKTRNPARTRVRESFQLPLQYTKTTVTSTGSLIAETLHQTVRFSTAVFRTEKVMTQTIRHFKTVYE